MVMLAPVKSKRVANPADRGGGRFVEQSGQPGNPPVEQPKLANPYAAGLADACKTAEGPKDWKPEAWEPEVPEWTGKRRFRVFIPGHPISVIPADNEDTARARYRSLNGIISTDVLETIEDADDPGDEDDGEDTIDDKKPAKARRKKAEDRPLTEQLDD